jgi:hypothetical protein
LTSKGIQLNSSPKEDESYFIIGEEPSDENPTPSYLKYTSDGNLKMKVNSFELIGASNLNLLHNTVPIEESGSKNIQ